jgi:hypothetical protein
MARQTIDFGIDLGTTNSSIAVLEKNGPVPDMERPVKSERGFGFFTSAREAAWVAVEVAVSTVDHPDIRGSKPHNRDPSGAASDYERGLGPKTCRIGTSRILLFLCPSTATHARMVKKIVGADYPSSR